MEKENIELRSEKVRNIVGEIPSLLVRFSQITITGLFLVLLVGFITIPYPQVINIDVQLESDGDSRYVGSALINCEALSYINEISEIEVKLINNEYTNNYVQCKIIRVIPEKIILGGKSFFKILVSCESNLLLANNMSCLIGESNIVIYKSTIGAHLIGKYFKISA